GESEIERHLDHVLYDHAQRSLYVRPQPDDEPLDERVVFVGALAARERVAIAFDDARARVGDGDPRHAHAARRDAASSRDDRDVEPLIAQTRRVRPHHLLNTPEDRRGRVVEEGDALLASRYAGDATPA